MSTEETADVADTIEDSGSASHLSDRRFADFPLSPEVLKGILDYGFEYATPVQAQTLEAALAGRDLLVRAKTGTGKTAAFSIPIIERIEDGERAARAIILAPVRELAQQIAEELSALAAYRDLRVAVCVGGVAMGPQEKALADGAEIIVGTPGRVLDHIRRGNLDLSGIRVACLDEADEMFSMGFYEDVTKILDKCPEDRQVLLFSATMDRDTERIVERYTKDAEEIYLSTDTDHVEGIEHILYETSPSFHKARALLYVLDVESPDNAIIFCNTREDTATVASYLDRQGLDAQLISGELPQSQRNRVMAKMKSGEISFLVATDVAARGIDISGVTHVINYSLPQDPSVYMHRIGRTGRIGNKGVAISLVGGTDIGTRSTLENVHKIQFQVRELPDAETAVRNRVERQAAQIRAAMGTMVFEAYLPTVRALKEMKGGDALLAAALRAFFQWDRRRRAEASGIDTVGALGDQRREDRKRRSEEDGRRGRKGRGSRDRDDRPKRERGDKPKRDRKRRSSAAGDDLDALLVAEAPSEGAPKRSRKRRRRKKGDRDGAASTPSTSELDALLSAE